MRSVHSRITRHLVRFLLLGVAVVLLVVAGSGVVDTFYIEPSAAVRARAAAGERRIAAAGIGLIGVGLLLPVVRLRCSALASTASGGVFLFVTRGSEASIATYVMVPLGALLIAAAAMVDLARQKRPS